MGPHANSFWSSEEWARAEQCFADGMNIAQTAQHLGKTYKQVAGKLLWENMTDAQRAKRRAQVNARRNASGEYKSTPRPDKPVARPRTSLKQLADRDKRYTIPPRDLTAQVFGDPLPGYSALEQRVTP
jgi:hypothetical protein